MDTKTVEKALTEVLAGKGSKKFAQSVDIIINLADIDIKKSDQHVDFFVTLPHSKGKENKVCGLVGPELHDESKEALDKTIESHDFVEFKDNPKKIKALAKDYTYFVAQANIMPQVATVFGKVLGPRGKMPNPKAGCVVPPKATLGPVKEKLAKTVRVSAKTSTSIKLQVGKETQDIKEISENILTIYNELLHHVPQGKHNVKDVLIKLTMGKPVKV